MAMRLVCPEGSLTPGLSLLCVDAADGDASHCSLIAEGCAVEFRCCEAAGKASDLLEAASWVARLDRFLGGTVSFECLCGGYLAAAIADEGGETKAAALGCAPDDGTQAFASRSSFRPTASAATLTTLLATSGTRSLLLFLDVDGPLAPWVNGKPHVWRATDRLTDAVYAPRAESLRWLASSVSNVSPSTPLRVIITSTWRTSKDKYGWLCRELAQLALPVVGFTDISDLWPEAPRDSISMVQRFAEIHQCMSTRRVATGIVQTPGRLSIAFSDFDELGVGDVAGYVAVDDLPLNIAHLQPFLPLPSSGGEPPVKQDAYVWGSWDTDYWEKGGLVRVEERPRGAPPGGYSWGGRHWMPLGQRYPSFARAYAAFRECHFVQVSPTEGIDEAAARRAAGYLLAGPPETAAASTAELEAEPLTAPLLSLFSG